MDKHLKQAVIGTSIVLIVIIGIIASILIEKFTPSKEIRELNDYYDVPGGEALVIMDDKIYEKNALFIDGMFYLDFDTVRSYYNSRFYWDTNENLLLYATPTELIRTETGSRMYYVNKTKNNVDYVIVKTVGDLVYIAADFVKLYSGLSYEFYEEPNRLILQCSYGSYLYMNVTKATQMRTEPDIKEDILRQLSVGDKVMLVDSGGIQKNGFIKVMTADGVRGYVKQKCLSEGEARSLENPYKAPEYTYLTKDYTINLTWHLITNADGNDKLSSMLENTKGITTISPTWFRVNSLEGTLSSLANEAYVEKAHNMGIEVWGLYDNFDKEVDSYQLLSYSSRREKLVNEIVSSAIKYNLDGINIDFESLSQETGPHFIQFLRELSIKCRSNNIVLSADNYVPMPYNKFYDLKEQGEIIDYVILMAYDEHHGASEDAGSVSSISYVDNAIRDALEMMPKERIITAVPFYTRLWKDMTEAGTGVDSKRILTSEALGMAAAQEVINKNGLTPIWNEVTAQYYAEYEKEGALFKIWMEERTSIEEKMKLIHEAQIAGVASWRLGFEVPEIWDVILKYVN